jgi:phosphoglycolate phosphatase
MIIIFDLDGTLINTIDDLGQACNHALSACGFPTHKIEDYPRLVGNGVNKLIERALPEEHRNEETVLRLREYFVPYYDEHNCDFTRPYDGIPELLEALRRKGDEAMRLKGEQWFLAVASNKYQAATEKIVAQLFPGIFDVVLGEREGVERKPHPQIVYDILSTLNSQLSTLNCLYIGDSLVDAETARAAGATLVLCTWGFGTREQMESAKPDYLVDHPLEVLEAQEFKSLGV